MKETARLSTRLLGERPLLQALRDFSFGRLYVQADKSAIFRGLALAREGVSELRWNGGSEILVRLNAGREIAMHLGGGSVVSLCDCGLESLCHHRIAAFAVLKKVLDPEGFSTVQLSSERLEEFSAALLQGREKKSSGPERFSIVILQDEEGTQVRVRDRGEDVLSFIPGLPVALGRLATASDWIFPKIDLLGEMLEREGQRWPIYYRQGKREIALRWRTERPCLRMRLNADAHGVLIQKMVDGRPAGRGDLLVGPFLLDLEGATLACAERTDLWRLFESLRGMTETLQKIEIDPGVRRFRAPLDIFRRIQIYFSESGREHLLGDLLLAVDGKEAAPEGGDRLLYCLQVRSGREEHLLTAEGWGGGQTYSIDPAAFALFADPLYESLSPPLRTFKRRVALMQAFFACAKESAARRRQAAFREAVAGSDFLKRAVRRDAKELIASQLQEYEQGSWVLCFDGEGWRLLPRDKEREKELLRIAMEIFGEKIFRRAEKPGMMRVARKAFEEKFSLLAAVLHDAGFGLEMDGHPVRPATLDMEVEAVASGIDWFEIRPEIRCDGKLLEEVDWRQALATGMLPVEGGMRVLDEETLRVLSELSRLLPPPASGKKKEKSEIVRIPRLQILDALALRRQGVRVRLPEEDEKILGRLLAFETLPERALPPNLHCTLRPYQHRGYDWLAFLYEHKLGACLADDMGLGKTVQTITLLAALKSKELSSRISEHRPHLVVVPPSLLFNWEAEIARFAPDLKVLVYRGKDRSPDFSEADVVLTSYDLVRRDAVRLSPIPFHVIVFDEAQAVKNIRAATTGGVRRLQGVFKIALTGTPVENRIEEYYAILDLAVPGLLGDLSAFGRGKRGEDASLLETVIRRTRPFVLRRTKAMIADELPARTETDIYLDLTEEQKAFYTRTAEEARRTVSAAYLVRSSAQARMTALAALMKLRRICLSPRLEGGEGSKPDPKIAFLLEHLQELKEEGHSVLVFSQFTSFLDLVEPQIVQEGFPCFRLDGSTPVAERKNLVQAFQNTEEPTVFLLSLKAGGRGLNLTRASYVFHLDPWWNPAVENQASDRAHRIGQTRKVTIIRLLMRHTVEEKMMVLKEKKLRLYQALLGEGKGEEAAISREEIEFLLGG